MTTTLKLWVMPNAGFESQRLIDRELTFFSEKNPKIKVECDILSWSQAWPRIIQAVKDKTGPDVIQVGTTWIGTLGYLGAIQNLDTRKINRAGFISTFYDICCCFGHLWALPWFCEGRVLYYRSDLLEKAGLSRTDLDTWDRFRLACAEVSRLRVGGKAVTPFSFSCQKEQALTQDIAAWIWANGGSFLSKDGKHAAVTHFESVQGIKYFLDLIAQKFIGRQSLDQSTGEVAENFFLNDSSAFLVTSSWPLQVYLNASSKNYVGKKNAAHFGVVPIPAGPAGRFNFAGGSALAVTSFSAEHEKAWKLVEFLTGRQSMARYCASIDMLPARSDLPVVLNAPDQICKVFSDSINHNGRGFPTHPLWGSIEQVVLNGFVQTLSEYRHNGFNQSGFFRNLEEMNLEIENILSVFGE